MKTFWSWQSDHPGPISRHFVREALEAAIKALNESPDIDDAARPEVTLDHDRKDVPGSPDLARTIFEKIEASQVFVADVTPVGAAPGDPPKKLMNANVAIELGFALATVTDRGLIMILNEHYGSREDLPFDLRHKAGPITYRLAPGASKDHTKQQSAQLAGHLKVALREMLMHAATRAAEKTPLEARPTIAGDPSRYASAGEIIVAHQGDGDSYRYAMPAGPLFFLRLIPTKAARELQRVEAHDLVRMGPDQLEPFCYQARSRGSIANVYGALSYSSRRDEGRVICGTQLFLNREIWGFDSDLLRDRKDKERGFPTLAVEETFAAGLQHYVRFATEKLGLAAPFNVVAGATGVKDFVLFMPPLPPHHWPEGPWGPVLEDQIVYNGILKAADLAEIDRVLVEIFGRLFDAAGRQRPLRLYKFPGDRPGAMPTR